MTSGSAIELLMLLAVIVLAIVAGLLLGVVLRRRARGGAAVRTAAEPTPMPHPMSAPAPPPVPVVRRVRAQPTPLRTTATTATTAPGGSAAPVSSVLAGAVSVGSTERSCPTCRTVYQDMIYCQRDARRLVSAEELAAPGRGVGLSCPRCGRSYEHGLRRCPHDGVELVAPALYHATRRGRAEAPTGVLAKVCPVCRRRFDLSSRFCGRDGHELVVVK